MKMIMDLDTGIDDALAIAYAAGLPEVRLIGVTATYGNVTIDKAVNNSLNILDILGRSDVPVYKGASCRLDQTPYHTSDILFRIHGNNGIGNVDLGTPRRNKSDLSAVDFIIESANCYQKDLTLLCAGPLTNLAKAIMKDSKAIGLIGQIVIMGGALTVPGNNGLHDGLFSEANIYNDPDAAKYVFESGIPIVLAGLDVTLKTMITGKDIAAWQNIKTKAAKVFIELTRYYYINEYNDEEIGGAMHDPLAVEVAVNPNIITHYLPINLTVETEGPSTGRTIGDLKRLTSKEKSAKVCLEVEGDRFVKKFVETVSLVLEKAK